MTKAKSWSISFANLSAHLTSQNLAIGKETPFRDNPSRAKKWKGKALTKRQERDIKLVAQPEYLVGLLLNPPFATGGLWFYGRKDRMVGCHKSTKDKTYSLVQVSASELSELVYTCLDLDLATPGLEIEWRLSPEAFFALLGLVDANREVGLRSLLNRAPGPDRSFTTQTLLEAVTNGYRCEDERWLSGLMEKVCPYPLNLNITTLERGLEQLTALGLTERKGKEWDSTPAFLRVFLHLSTPLGYASLYGRRIGSGDFKSLVCLRMEHSLWTLEFLANGVVIASRNEREVTGLMADAIPKWQSVWAEDEPITSSRSKNRVSTIGCSCGTSIPADANFCPGCGKALKDEKNQVCIACGEKLVEGAAFCKECGSKV